MTIHDIIQQCRSFGSTGRKSQIASIQTRGKSAKPCGEKLPQKIIS